MRARSMDGCRFSLFSLTPTLSRKLDPPHDPPQDIWYVAQRVILSGRFYARSIVAEQG